MCKKYEIAAEILNFAVLRQKMAKINIYYLYSAYYAPKTIKKRPTFQHMEVDSFTNWGEGRA